MCDATDELVRAGMLASHLYILWRGELQVSFPPATSEAALTVVGTQGAIKKCVKLAEDGKYGDALALLKDPKVSGFEDQITKVVNAEGLLTPEDRVSLGTIRRYGVVADYIITVGGAKAELEEGKSGLRLLRLASNSIDEIAQIPRSARAVPK